ncbi:hypothetical protein PUN28_014891 [Cardiocondyla obscurior]|uniref:Uncharacterized protein n=1 Tax=Cardiocondyla obscurior TaxID=286306 RepID=A0AAW2EZ37_9HYME
MVVSFALRTEMQRSDDLAYGQVSSSSTRERTIIFCAPLLLQSSSGASFRGSKKCFGETRLCSECSAQSVRRELRRASGVSPTPSLVISFGEVHRVPVTAISRALDPHLARLLRRGRDSRRDRGRLGECKQRPRISRFSSTEKKKEKNCTCYKLLRYFIHNAILTFGPPRITRRNVVYIYNDTLLIPFLPRPGFFIPSSRRSSFLASSSPAGVCLLPPAESLFRTSVESRTGKTVATSCEKPDLDDRILPSANGLILGGSNPRNHNDYSLNLKSSRTVRSCSEFGKLRKEKGKDRYTDVE